MDEPDMVQSDAASDWQESRRKRLLAGLDWSSTRGVEIGPLAAPLALRPRANVRYVDVVDTAQLHMKYADDPNVKTDDIVAVDAVWGTKTLTECFAAEEPFDWVIASHVVEHVPDLIGWLAEISSILCDGGQLYLAVPDNRVTFDCFRSTSSIAEIVAAHLGSSRQSSLAQLFSQTLYFANVTSNELWAAAPDPAKHLSIAQLQQAWDTTRYAAETGDAVDIHCWVLTPRTWLETMIALSELSLLNYRCTSFTATAPGENEFFVTLEKLPAADAQNNAVALADFRRRLQLLEAVPAPGGATTHEQHLADVLAQKFHGAINPAPAYAPAPQATVSSWRSRISEPRTSLSSSNWAAQPALFPSSAGLGAVIPDHSPLYAGYGVAIDADHEQIAGLPLSGGLINLGIPGYLRVPDALVLYELAYFCEEDALELVAHSALSTLFLCQAMVNAGSTSKLVSVETREGYAPHAQQIIAGLDLDAVLDSRMGDALTVLDECTAKNRRFGLVFIDFDQSAEVLRPVADRLPTLLASGGLVVFHDFNDVRNAGAEPEYKIYAVVEKLVSENQLAFITMVGCCAVLQAP